MQDIEIAKDLVQDVMIQVYRSKDRIDVHTTFKGYLLTALRNRLFNYKRDELAKKVRQAAAGLNEQTADEVKNYLDHKEILQQVQAMLAKLPEQCRQVFLLRREANLSNQQVAERLGISVKTVEAHMTKALKFLRENIDLTILVGVMAGWNY